MGEVNAKDYEEDLIKMAEEYKVRNEAGECFVHVRRKHSSSRGAAAKQDGADDGSALGTPLGDTLGSLDSPSLGLLLGFLLGSALFTLLIQ